jgi:hypothetical protein
MREYARRRYLVCPERYMEQNRRWIAANRDYWLAQRRRYLKTHVEQVHHYNAKRRAALKVVRELIGHCDKKNLTIAWKIIQQIGESNHDHGTS